MLDYLQVGYIHQVPFTRSVIYRHFSTLTSKMCNPDAKQAICQVLFTGSVNHRHLSTD